jgi:hypothetical protein
MYKIKGDLKKSMKKIAILTINDYMNYGNRLQNYATQEVIKALGFSVETVVNNTTNNNNLVLKKRKLFGRIFDNNAINVRQLQTKITGKLWYEVNKKKIEAAQNRRAEAFINFTKDNIAETDYKISDDNIPSNLGERFDYFLTGSDQVWNPIFRNGSSIDFLSFAPKKKRIAYAPSFGIAKISSEYKEDYKKWLSDFYRLSVREETGARIIKELTSRDSVVLVDPTLMLTKEKWLSVAKIDNSKPKRKYLLTYFLGGISEENKAKIKKVAKENKLQIVNFSYIKDLEAYSAGPSEFIDYINSASVLFTDSFHGSVFSMLLGTPFVVFDRAGNLPSMNSRIDTLLKTFKLETRKSKNVVNNEQIFEANYTHIEEILEIERSRAIEYLKEALSIE